MEAAKHVARPSNIWCVTPLDRVGWFLDHFGHFPCIWYLGSCPSRIIQFLDIFSDLETLSNLPHSFSIIYLHYWDILDDFRHVWCDFLSYVWLSFILLVSICHYLVILLSLMICLWDFYLLSYDLIQSSSFMFFICLNCHDFLCLLNYC